MSEEWRDQNSVFRDETALEAFDLDDGLPSFDDLVRLVKNERLRFILRAVYVDRRIYEDVGRELGITKQRVEQLIKKAHAEIRRKHEGIE